MPEYVTPEQRIRRQCEGITRDGTRCERPPIPGGTVCMFHGGANPIAQASAKRKMLQMVEPALLVLSEAMEKADWPVAVRAALGLLDRAGLGPHSTVTVQDERTDLEGLTDAALEQRTLATIAQLREKREEAAKIIRAQAQAQSALTLEELAKQEEERMNDGPSNESSSIH